MKVCEAVECVMPARWRVKLIVRPPTHYEPWATGVVQTGLCFCEVHRRQVSVDALFTRTGRIALDRKYTQLGQPAPDWARCTLGFDELNMRGEVNGAQASGAEPVEGADA